MLREEELEKIIPDGYKELQLILEAALRQAACGKGKERHARPGEAWVDQPIIWIQKTNIGLGFPLGQVVKKCDEVLGGAMLGGIGVHREGDPPIQQSDGMRRRAAARELLGGIVYLAAAVAGIASQDGVALGAEADGPDEFVDWIRGLDGGGGTSDGCS